MALSYEVDNTLKALEPVMAEQGEWFNHVMRHLFYAETYGEVDTEIPMVLSFRAWLRTIENEGFIEEATIRDIVRLHDDLQKAAAGMIMATRKSKKKPDVVLFDALCDLYEDFTVRTRRLELDCLVADNGIDAVTGLRNKKAMDRDLERELERRARRGRPLCLVIATVDDFENIKNLIDENQSTEIVKSASGIIKQCVRSFDDAYRSDDAEFVMALKHAETSGGTAAIMRLRALLAESPILMSKDGKLAPVTMSYCAAEILPGDNIEQLLDNMRADLRRYEKEDDLNIEYHEKSALQRFLQEENLDGKEAG